MKKIIFLLFTFFFAATWANAEKVFHVGTAGNPGTLDPHKASGTWENMVIGDAFMGLMTEDAEAKPIPGSAQSYTVSDDGKVYTFTLRNNLTWSDGTPMTGEDFVFSFRRILSPDFPAKYANLLFPIKNAEAYKTGKLSNPDDLGVASPASDKVVITLENPTPYFLGLLTHYTTYPVPKHLIEKVGDDWVKPGNMVNNGPYVITEWVPNTYVKSVKNKNFYDASNVKIDTVYYYPTEDRSTALKQFRAGELDMNEDFPTDQINWMKMNIPEAIKTGPYLGIYYYTINVKLEKFKDVRVRKALSMAINRKVITDRILRSGDTPATSFIPAIGNYVPATLDFAGMPGATHLQEARRLIEEAGYSKDKPLKITLSYNTSENHKRVAVAVSQMWKYIHVETELYNSDVAVHYDSLQNQNYEVGRAGWIADYPDPQNFLFLMTYPNQLNYTGWENDDYMKLYNESNLIADDPAMRNRVMQQAEQLALDNHVYIPIYYYSYKQLVGPRVLGWKGNSQNIHRTRWLDLKN